MKKLKNPDAISGITSKVMLVSTILLTPTTMMASKIQGGIQTPLSVGSSQTPSMVLLLMSLASR